MKVRLAYRPGVVWVTPSSTLREAAAAMRESGQSCVPLVDGEVVVGIVTEHDIVAAVAHGIPTAKAWALDHAHDGGTSVALDDDCDTAALKMLVLGCRHLPVVDRGRLVGVVSIRDVVLKPLAAKRRRRVAA